MRDLLSIDEELTMGVPGETVLAGGGSAAVTPGSAYVIWSPAIPNLNGIVVICPPSITTVSALLAHFGYSGTVGLANVAQRAAGLFIGPGQMAKDFLDG
jgi:hypothetical protein